MERITCRFLLLLGTKTKLNHQSTNFISVQARHLTANVATATSVSTTDTTVGNAGTDKAVRISKAMKAYLERAQKYNAFMQNEVAEFEIGKHHLANIMGVDPDNFTQEDVDSAIQYLLPSGLFDKKARPKLKHPLEVLPRRKAVQFDVEGRPFNSFFYTGRPFFSQTLHDISMKTIELKKFEDSQIAQNIELDPSQQLQMIGSVWLPKHVLEDKFDERLTDNEYNNFIISMEQLCKLPYSFREEEFIFQFRRQLQVQKNTLLSDGNTNLKTDESGREYHEAEGTRKKARASIKLFDKGSGNYSVNGKGLLEWFPRLVDREQVLFPLHLTDKLGTVDFEANVVGGGPSGQAGAIRHGLSLALKFLVNADVAEKMRLAGLLTKDPRTLERQKPGQSGARRKYTWKKR